MRALQEKRWCLGRTFATTAFAALAAAAVVAAGAAVTAAAVVAAGVAGAALAGCDACKDKRKAPGKSAEARSANGNAAGGRRPGGPTRGKPPTTRQGGDVAPHPDRIPLPADADAVMEISITRMRGLPFWATFKRGLGALPYRRFAELVKKSCGLDPLEQVEHILAGVRFESSDGVVLVRGRDHMAKKVAGCLPKIAKATKIKELTIRAVTAHGLSGAEIRFGKTGPVRFIMLDENRFSLSAGAWLDAPVRPDKDKVPTLGPDSHILRVRRTLKEANLAWIVFLGIPPAVKSVLPSMAAVARVRTIGAGLTRKDEAVAARVVLDMRKPKSAEGLASMLKSVLPQLKKIRPAFERFDPFLAKVRFTTQGPLLAVELALDHAEIKKLYSVLTYIVKTYISVPRVDEGTTGRSAKSGSGKARRNTKKK